MFTLVSLLPLRRQRKLPLLRRLVQPTAETPAALLPVGLRRPVTAVMRVARLAAQALLAVALLLAGLRPPGPAQAQGSEKVLVAAPALVRSTHRR